MKKNRIILIITIILAVTAFIFIYTATKSTLSKSLSDFAIEDTSMVTKVFLSDKANNKVTLTKHAPGNWTVNNECPVSNDLISIFLKTAMRLEVKAPVAKAARNNIIKRLSSIGIKTEIYQTVYRIDLWGIKLFPHEKLIKTYYVGDATMDNMGTYMLLENSDNPYIMHIPGFRGFLNSRYSVYEKDWRDHTILSVALPNIKSVKLEFPSAPESSYIIENQGNSKFTLTALKSNTQIANYDTLKLMEALSTFRDIRFEFLITDSKTHNKDSIIQTTPFHILTVTDLSGKTKVIKTYHKSPPFDQEELDGGIIAKYDLDRLYASFNDGKDFALIQFFMFDNILRPLQYFIKPSKNIKPAKK